MQKWRAKVGSTNSRLRAQFNNCKMSLRLDKRGRGQWAEGGGRSWHWAVGPLGWAKIRIKRNGKILDSLIGRWPVLGVLSLSPTGSSFFRIPFPFLFRSVSLCPCLWNGHSWAAPPTRCSINAAAATVRAVSVWANSLDLCCLRAAARARRPANWRDNEKRETNEMDKHRHKNTQTQTQTHNARLHLHKDGES